MDFKPTTIAEFQYLAIETLLNQFPVIKSAGVNSLKAGAITTPAMYLELTEFSYPENVPASDSSLNCQFSLKLVGSGLIDKPIVALEDLAIEVSRFIRGNRWDLYAEPAQILSSSCDDFSPIDDAYRVWDIRFSQQISIKEHAFMLEKSTLEHID